MDWLMQLLAALVGGGASVYGANQAADAIPEGHEQNIAGYDPNANPLLALLNAFSSSGLGFAPDPNIIQAASPVNRLENSLLNSLGRVSNSRDLRFLNQAISTTLGELRGAAESGNADPAALEQAIENAFMQFRSPRGEEFFNAAQTAVGAGGDVAGAIADQILGPSDFSTGFSHRRAQLVGEIQTAIDAGEAEGLSGGELARYLTNEVVRGERPGQQAGLFRTALTSAGFDDIGDLLAQEQEFRTRAADTTQRLGGLAESRFGARESANMTIDRLLRDYPAYGASDIERESMLALEPYQAQELERANAMGYNPSTNLALTRSAGIRDALGILQGRQGLTNTALMALRNELGQQTGEALATSGQTGAAMANAAHLASQQALALNQLGMQGSMYQGSALGGGTGAAGAYLSDFLANIGQPGTGGSYSYYRPGSNGSTTGGGYES